MTNSAAEAAPVVRDTNRQIVPAVAIHPARRHRATGKPRGGRRVYSLDVDIAENVYVYTPELANEILSRMAAGETVAEICRSRPDFPDPRTVRQWKYDVEGFGRAYARAQA